MIMKTITFSLCLLFFAFFTQAQISYRITYTQHAYAAYQPLWPAYPLKFKSVFNDSFYFSFPVHNKSEPLKNGRYGLKFVRHSILYNKLIDQWYLANPKKRKKIWDKAEGIKINWQVHTDSVKTISGYKCTKATGVYQNKLILVWFTSDIPGNQGAHSVFLYPGVPLEVYYPDRSSAFIAEKIEKNVYEIQMPNL